MVTSAEVFSFLVALHGPLVVLDLLKQLTSLSIQDRMIFFFSDSSQWQVKKWTRILNLTFYWSVYFTQCKSQTRQNDFFFLRQFTMTGEKVDEELSVWHWLVSVSHGVNPRSGSGSQLHLLFYARFWVAITQAASTSQNVTKWFSVWKAWKVATIFASQAKA